jgi:hypothetical protein
VEVGLVVLGAVLALTGGLLGDLWRDERAARRGAGQVQAELTTHYVRWTWWFGEVERRVGAEATNTGTPWTPPEGSEATVLAEVRPDWLAYRYGLPLPAVETSAYEAFRPSFQELLSEDDLAALATWYITARPGPIAISDSYNERLDALEAAQRGVRTVRARRLPRLTLGWIRRRLSRGSSEPATP